MIRELILNLTDEELLYILETRLPGLLDRHPELLRRVKMLFIDTLARQEEVAAIMAELRELRTEFHGFQQETRERFDRVDQRFDQVDRRFDEIDRWREKADQRFDQVDRRFDEIDRWREKADQRFDHLEQQFRDLRDWVEMVVGRFQVRSGRRLEDVVAGALRLALKRPDIRPESIRLRQRIVDTEGWVFPRGKIKEIDLVASDSEYLVFEVKTAAEPEDVDDFADKVELVRRLNPDKTVHGVFITMAPEPDVQERCRERGVELAR